jgi:anti-sigma regulatory factor (Ser/Thr protein kinase)
MKKIACFIKNNFIFDSIKKFCEVESFEIYDLASRDFIYEHSIIIIMTDSYFEIKDIDFKDIPICLIGENVNSISYYFLDYNFNHHQLRKLIDIVYQGGVLASYTSSVQFKNIYKQLVIKNDIFNIDKIVNSFTKELVYFFTISEVQNIRIAISEMLTNAIEHGNLSITGYEKFEATEAGTYIELVEERLNDPRYSNNHTHVTLEINNYELIVTIKDDGQGFDVKTIDENIKSENLLKLHGRGILITKMYFDEVCYNDKGNEVTLKKKRSR